MKIIPPIEITSSTLVSSNISESTQVEWDSAAPYSAGDVVKVSYKQDGVTPAFPVTEFRCVLGHDSPHYPADDDGTYWLDLGAANKWRWTDKYINTQTVADGSEITDPGKIVMTLRADKCNAIAILMVTGSVVTIERYDSDNVIIDTVVHVLQNSRVYGDWWSYFYEDFVFEHDIMQEFGIMHVQTIKLTIEHNPAAGLYPAVGYILLGRATYIGETKYDFETGISDYSIKDKNETTGYVFLKEGNYSKWMDIDVSVNTEDADRVQQILTSCRGKLAFYYGNNDGIQYERLNILGYYQDFTNLGQTKLKSKIRIEIQGAI